MDGDGGTILRYFRYSAACSDSAWRRERRPAYSVARRHPIWWRERDGGPVTSNEILLLARTTGMVFEARGNTLRVKGPKGSLTPERRAELLSHKPALLALLAPVIEFISLTGGLVVPAPALLLALDLERRGFTMSLDQDQQFQIEPSTRTHRGGSVRHSPLAAAFGRDSRLPRRCRGAHAVRQTVTPCAPEYSVSPQSERLCRAQCSSGSATSCTIPSPRCRTTGSAGRCS